MAIVTGSNKSTAKKTNTINAVNLTQLNNVIQQKQKEDSLSEIETVTSKKENTEASEKKENAEKTVPVSVSAQTSTQASSASKKREYSDTVILNLPKGERSEFKAFCAKYQLTMTDYIYFTMDYVRNNVEQGKLSVSRSGIKEIANG